MKKIALALLLVFAVFTWACEDGVDERASFGGAEASVSFDNSVQQFDLYTWDNTTNPAGACLSTLQTDAVRQAFTFRVWPKPGYNGAITRVNVKGIDVKYTPFTAGAPAIKEKKLKVGDMLYIPEGDSNINETIEYTTTVEYPLFYHDEIRLIASLYGSSPLTYTVDYKFKLIEIPTGIEDELIINGLTVTFSDLKDNETNCRP
jgi:hypothetical protein